jgi:hypothetical protein
MDWLHIAASVGANVLYYILYPILLVGHLLFDIVHGLLSPFIYIGYVLKEIVLIPWRFIAEFEVRDNIRQSTRPKLTAIPGTLVLPHLRSHPWRNPRLRPPLHFESLHPHLPTRPETHPQARPSQRPRCSIISSSATGKEREGTRQAAPTGDARSADGISASAAGSCIASTKCASTCLVRFSQEPGY